MSLNCLVSGRFDTSRFDVNRSRFDTHVDSIQSEADSIQTSSLLSKIN